MFYAFGACLMEISFAHIYIVGREVPFMTSKGMTVVRTTSIEQLLTRQVAEVLQTIADA